MTKILATALLSLSALLIGCGTSDNDAAPTGPKPLATLSTVSMPDDVRVGSEMAVDFEISAEGELADVAVSVYLVPVPDPASTTLSEKERQETEEDLRDMLRAPTPEQFNSMAIPLYTQVLDELPMGDNGYTLNFGAAYEQQEGNFIPVVILDDTPENNSVDDVLMKSEMNEQGEKVNQRIFVLPTNLEIVRTTSPDLIVRDFTSSKDWVSSVPILSGEGVTTTPIDAFVPQPTYPSPPPEDGSVNGPYIPPADIEMALSVVAFVADVTGDVEVEFSAQIDGMGEIFPLQVRKPTGNAENEDEFELVNRVVFGADATSGKSFVQSDVRGVEDNHETLINAVDAAEVERQQSIDIEFPRELWDALATLGADTPLVLTAEVNPDGAIIEDNKKPNTMTFSVMYLHHGQNQDLVMDEGAAEVEEPEDATGEPAETASWSTISYYKFENDYGNYYYTKVYPRIYNYTRHKGGCALKTHSYANLDVAVWASKRDVLDCSVTMRLSPNYAYNRNYTYLQRYLRIIYISGISLTYKTCVNDYKSLGQGFTLNLSCTERYTRSKTYGWGPASVKVRLRMSFTAGLGGRYAYIQAWKSGGKNYIRFTADSFRPFYYASGSLSGEINLALAGITASGSVRLWEAGLSFYSGITLQPGCKVRGYCGIRRYYYKPKGKIKISAWRKKLNGSKDSTSWTLLNYGGGYKDKYVYSRSLSIN